MKYPITFCITLLIFSLSAQIDLNLQPVSKNASEISVVVSGDDMLISTSNEQLKIKTKEFEYLVRANEENFSGDYNYSIGNNDYLIKLNKTHYGVNYNSIEKIAPSDVEVEPKLDATAPIRNERYASDYTFSLIKKGDLLFIANNEYGNIYENVERNELRRDKYGNTVYQMLNDTTYFYKKDTVKNMCKSQSGVYSLKKKKWLVDQDKFNVLIYKNYGLIIDVDTTQMADGKLAYPNSITVIDPSAKTVEKDLEFNDFFKEDRYKKYRLKNYYNDELVIIYNQPDYYNKNEDDLILFSSVDGFSQIDYDNPSNNKSYKDFIFSFKDQLFKIHGNEHVFNKTQLKNSIDIDAPYEIRTLFNEVKVIQGSDTLKTGTDFYDGEFSIYVKDDQVAFYSYEKPRVKDENIISGYSSSGEAIYKTDEDGYYISQKVVQLFKSTCAIYNVKKKLWIIKPGTYDVIDKEGNNLKLSQLNKDLSVEDDMDAARNNISTSKSINW